MKNSPLWLKIFAAFAGLYLLLPIIALLFDASKSLELIKPLLSNSETWKTMGNSLLLALASATPASLIAVPSAWFLCRCQLPFRRFWLILSIIPLAMPSYVSAYGYIAVFNFNGLLYQISPKLSFDIRNFYGAWLSMTMVNYPVSVRICRSALQQKDPALEESAHILGCSKSQVFFKITLPLLKPAIISGMLLVALYCLSDLGTPYLMNTKTFTLDLFTHFENGGFSEGAILSIVLLITAIFLLFSENIFQKRGQLYSLSGVARKPKLYNCGLWTGPICLFLLLVAAFAFIMPISAIIHWFLIGLKEEIEIKEQIAPFFESLKIAGLTCIITTITALPIAYFCSRFKGPISSLLNKLSFLGNATPGIVIALAFVSFFSSFHSLYQTLFLMALALGLRFMPQAFASLKSTFDRINPKVEEAARDLGANSFNTFIRVSLPMALPGILASLALVFITTIKELPITLILATPGKRFLPQEIWDNIDEGEFSLIASPALLLLCISSLSLFFILRQERNS